jgi:hypothetical protein
VLGLHCIMARLSAVLLVKACMHNHVCVTTVYTTPAVTSTACRGLG